MLVASAGLVFVLTGRLGGSCGGGGISGGPSADRAGAGGTGSGVGRWRRYRRGRDSNARRGLGRVGRGRYRSCSPVRHTETGSPGEKRTRVTEQSEERSKGETGPQGVKREEIKRQ